MDLFKQGPAMELDFGAITLTVVSSDPVRNKIVSRFAGPDTIRRVTADTYRLFLDISRRKLLEEDWTGICHCLEVLNEDQIWWRPNPTSNSIGNLLLHLNGNVQQWLVAPLGGPTQQRNRPAEFAEKGPIPVADLRDRLAATLKEVEHALSQAQPAALEQTYNIQNRTGVTGLEAVYHVVEHFSMHYGQILYITKFLTSQDLGFYRHLDK